MKHLQYTVQLGSPIGNPQVYIMLPTVTFVNYEYNIKITQSFLQLGTPRMVIFSHAAHSNGPTVIKRLDTHTV